MAAHYRTKNRGLILRVLRLNPNSSTVQIHSQLEQLFNSQTWQMKTLPSLRQCFRTVADLRDSGLIVAVKIGTANYYRRSY